MLKKYLITLTNFIFPRLCLACQIKIAQGYLCATCHQEITYLKLPLCRFCSQPISKSAEISCKNCSQKAHPYSRLISAVEYKKPLSSLVHLFKYQHYNYLGEFLASLLINRLEALGFSAAGYDYLAAVPLHPYKLKMRGYNQAELLARPLANYFKIPLKNDIIEVAQFKPSQTKLAKTERQDNVAGIFRVRESLENLNLLLVDDIFTTGSTIKACAQSLREKGVAKITVLTLAKTSVK